MTADYGSLLFCRVQGEEEKEEEAEDIYGGTTDDEKEETMKKGRYYKIRLTETITILRERDLEWENFHKVYTAVSTKVVQKKRKSVRDNAER